MQENSRVITDELLEAFLQCKYKARLRALGRTGQPADFEKNRTSQAPSHRAQGQAKLFPPPRAAPGPEAPPALLDAATLRVSNTTDGARDPTLTLTLSRRERGPIPPSPSG